MCKHCREECDDDYEGDSIAEKRQKATRSILQRHPELGLKPDRVQFRFVPKGHEKGIRINLGIETPHYEIRVPSSLGQAMSSSPWLPGIAMAACLETELSYDEICEILAIRPYLTHNALFVSEHPPVDPARMDSRTPIHEYEEAITEQVNESI